MTEQKEEGVKAFRVDFQYTEVAAIHIAAETEEKAAAGAVAMLKARVKNPVVTRVTDVTEPELSDELGEALTPENVLN